MFARRKKIQQHKNNIKQENENNEMKNQVKMGGEERVRVEKEINVEYFSRNIFIYIGG